MYSWPSSVGGLAKVTKPSAYLINPINGFFFFIELRTKKGPLGTIATKKGPNKNIS
jgi:hypothetical protein